MRFGDFEPSDLNHLPPETSLSPWWISALVRSKQSTVFLLLFMKHSLAILTCMRACLSCSTNSCSSCLRLCASGLFSIPQPGPEHEQNEHSGYLPICSFMFLPSRFLVRRLPNWNSGTLGLSYREGFFFTEFWLSFL